MPVLNSFGLHCTKLKGCLPRRWSPVLLHAKDVVNSIMALQINFRGVVQADVGQKVTFLTPP